MKRLAREYLTAVQAFTRIPVTGSLGEWMGYGPLQLRASAAHLPGVGILVGMAACVAFAVVSLLLPDAPAAPLAAAIASTATTVLLAGGRDEQGLADFTRLPGVPAAGTIALVLALGLKVALLAVMGSQSPAGLLAALIAAHAVSRLGPLVVASKLPFTGDAAAAKATLLAEGVEPRAVRVGAAWCIAPLVLLAVAGRTSAVVLGVLATGAACWWMQRYLRRRGEGASPASLGAVQQLGELAFYLGAGIGIGSGR